MANEHNPRRVALNTLNAVFNDEAYANIALDENLVVSRLSEIDRNLVTALVYGTISKKITLEWYLKPFVKKSKKWVKNLLLLTIYQMIYMDKIPTSAAVDEAVKLAKKQGDPRLAGFVNGVLRNFSRTPLREFDEIKSKNERLSIQYSMPEFLVKKFIKQFDFDRTVKILESLDKPSKASLRVNTAVATVDDVQMKFDKLVKSELSPVGLVADSGNFAKTLEFKSGWFTMQDETSQLVAPQLDITGTEEILDACAAPGGKTTHIATYLTTGHITALDLYDHKLKLIEQNARRLQVADKIITEKCDATKISEHFTKEFDRILVDAPCSGIGLIRRKPDIRYRKESSDFTNLQNIQLEILDSAAKHLTKSGIMVYSTCTIFDEENFDVVEKFLATHSDFEQVEIAHEKSDIITKGCVFITPDMYHTDGFFIAKFKKK
ncbi:16S rRNA (cytosine(967)-C(5))-methyltransferase RsmB [Lactococcus nasutitermitis]|uniref:16S rRNA (cytosine(967)-C(5))-methyltransferase n=1 Tax=Lactococcus nasutitermitis TaxID=1652957 RepID=A0ABV9JAJ7_9LACT|nr:16S rRNA (cytosine(967)-C(5))-methyltransferase RsmB [Lactococcus nasutitermitis]